MARTQAIVTQLIYDHTLRMRAKVAAEKDKKGSDGKETKDAEKKDPTKMPAINNLVTNDLKTYTDASTFVLLVCTSP